MNINKLAVKQIKITKKESKKAERKKTGSKEIKAKEAVVKPVIAKKAEPKVPLAKKTHKPAKKIEPRPKPRRYFESIGRRKTSIARVRLYTARPLEEYEGRIAVNGRPHKEYFPAFEFQQIVEGSLNKLKSLNRFEVSVKVRGGGVRSQAEAIRHGLARALVKFNADFRKKLKRAGYLRRDPRMKERRKYGLKKARRAPQWSKR